MDSSSTHHTKPMARHATENDFRNWQEQAQCMTDAELVYAAKDCRAVEALWRGVDGGIVEGFYSDQASTYGMELTKRRQR